MPTHLPHFPAGSIAAIFTSYRTDADADGVGVTGSYWVDEASVDRSYAWTRTDAPVDTK